MANSKFYVVPEKRTVTLGMKESGSYFLCPSNTVMTGRYHKGDENGQTQYEYATLKAVDVNGNLVSGAITVEDIRWDSYIKESSGNGYSAPANRVIVGRQHKGDENGQTRYATAVIKIDGKTTTLEEGLNSYSIKESSGIWSKADEYRVMTGRHHSGDENGQTYYTYAKVMINYSSTEPAPEGTIIVPSVRTESANMKENGSSFMCPSGTIMTGRTHTGDENGVTQYEYSTLKAINSQGEVIVGSITIEDIEWDVEFCESSGMGYDAPKNRVVVGRQHLGDENGSTKYATAVVKFNGHPTEIRNYAVSETRKESGGWNWFKTSEEQVLTGRHHFGDENGNTYYSVGIISCDITKRPQDKFEVVLALHPKDKWFPMTPTDFITLSRFRRHNEGSSDDGYNKNTKGFVNGNSHGAEYYNILVNTINTYHLTGSDALYNLRPRDKNSIGNNEVFLQPDDNLNGNLNPDGTVPVFTYSSFYTDVNSGVKGERREFWVFYGYDEAGALGASFSHQGDWERIILDIVDGSIQGAWLSQHKDLIYYPAGQLEISKSNEIQTLKVYSAIGSHAHYNKVGEYPRYDILGKVIAKDYAKDGGYQWNITKNVLPLEQQEWKDYAGAWGEIGTGLQPWGDATSGPLGPWYKIWDFGTQNDEHIPLSSLISSNQILLVPDVRYESKEIKESSGIAFEAPMNMLVTGRKHSKDENGYTQYQYASLKAIDSSGKQINGVITISDLQWSDEHKESDSANFFQASNGRVITGRQHFGDENGNTRYQTGVVLFNGKQTTVLSASTLLANVNLKESGGIFFRSASRFILLGRTHTGDENGKTTYYQGYIRIDK